MITLIALVLAQAPLCYRQGGETRCYPEGNRVAHGNHVARAGGRAGGAPPLAFFEFAPASGTGMGSACACVAVTGAKGEVITHTRATAAICLKQGLAITGIADGDAVSCGNNLPRVESDGTALGLLMEEARTNRLQQSNNVAAAPWSTANGGGSAAAVVTAAYATGPDGVANSASRLQVDACPTSGSSFSIAFQNYTPTGLVKQSASAFIKGTSGSGTIAMYIYDTSSGLQITCSYNPTTWTWCGGPATPLIYTPVVLSGQVGIGCTHTTIPGHTNTGAADVLVWGANLQTGAFPTNPIATTTSVVTRNADTNTLNASTFPGAPFSMSGYLTSEAPSGIGAINSVLEGLVGTATGAGFFNSGGSFRLSTNNSGNAFAQAAPAVVAGTTYKTGGVNSGGNSTVYFNGAIIAGPTATNSAAQPWSTTTGVGYAPAGGAGWQANGIVSRLCVDSSTTKCVP